MATSDNPFVPIPRTDTDEPEDHQHDVPIVNVDDGDRKTLEDDYGEPPLKPEDEVPEEDPEDEPLAAEDKGLDVPVGEDTAESDDEIFRERHAQAEARLASLKTEMKP